MSIKNVFKSTLPHNTYLFANGKAAVFINGRYETDNASEIAQLTIEVENGIPFIYVDPKDASVDSTLQDEIRDAQIEAMKAVYARRAAAAIAPTEVMETKSASPFDSASSNDVIDSNVNKTAGANTAENTGGTPISTDSTSAASAANPSNSVASILAARKAAEEVAAEKSTS